MVAETITSLVFSHAFDIREALIASVDLNRATWYCWLLTGFYLYSVNLQGNVVPFLQAEFALSYRAVSLHSSAIAVGIILVGFLGDRVEARLGRRRTLWLGLRAWRSAAPLLCLSAVPSASISACFLMGALGGLLPAIVPAVLAGLHDERRVNAAPKPLHWPCGAAEGAWPGQTASFAQWTTRASPGLY